MSSLRENVSDDCDNSTYPSSPLTPPPSPCHNSDTNSGGNENDNAAETETVDTVDVNDLAESENAVNNIDKSEEGEKTVFF